MVVVVAFSSSLDVAAIEMEIGRPLDYDHELKTVGMSNAISGALGGYTGSYIFSQTIFNLRAKVKSRLTGVVISCAEGLVFLLPFSVLAYVPKIGAGGSSDISLAEPAFGFTNVIEGHPFAETPYFTTDGTKSWIYGATYERQPNVAYNAAAFLFTNTK